MFKCNECGACFEVPKTVCDFVPIGQGEVYGTSYENCPFCGGDFEESQKCEMCGNYFNYSNFDDVCEDCLKELKMRFSKFLHTNFSSFEIDALNAIFDGKNLE